MVMELTDSGRQRLETSIIAGTLVVLAVAIRFWCKFLLKSRIHSEDWWILAAVPIYVGAVADDIWGTLAFLSFLSFLVTSTTIPLTVRKRCLQWN